MTPAGLVLIIDDSEEIRDVLSAVLMGAGYRTIEAADGMAAMSALAASDEMPCLIILDLMMPAMDGIEFRDAQLVDPRLAGIPVVVLSAYPRLANAGSLGAVAYIPKPVDPPELIAIVAQHCLRASNAD